MGIDNIEGKYFCEGGDGGLGELEELEQRRWFSGIMSSDSRNERTSRRHDVKGQ